MKRDFNSFRDFAVIMDDLKMITHDDLWLEKGLIVIGYSTVGEKICLGERNDCLDEIWRVNDDTILQNGFKFLAFDIFGFVEGLVSVREI